MTHSMNRRALLGQVAALVLPVAAVATVAAMPADPDAEIIALSAEILRRHEEAEEFQATHIDPFHERFEAIGHDETKPRDVRWEEAFAFSRESGREAAIEALQNYDDITDALLARMMAKLATTQPGRAAKLRALLVYVMREEWRGPDEELEWHHSMTRALLGEFAGMSAEELAAI